MQCIQCKEIKFDCQPCCDDETTEVNEETKRKINSYTKEIDAAENHIGLKSYRLTATPIQKLKSYF